METIVLTIDGKKITSPAGTSILEAALYHGIKIPNLCYHPELKPFGACRMCLVEDEKTGRLMAACVTPVAPEMMIHTASSRVVNHRRNITRLMIAEHPESCILCSKGNRCRLRWVAGQLGIGETNLYHTPNYKPFEEANPFIIRDLSKCILCGKCVRADHELVGVGAIEFNERGFGSRPATLHELRLEQSSCTFCGTCVSMCPTGALSTKNVSFAGNPQNESVSICGFCSVGCSLVMGTAGTNVIEVNPAQLPHSVNGATLCVRGHFAHDYLNSPERLIRPMVRENGNRDNDELVPVEWEKALDSIAHRLMEIKTRYGPQSIAFMGSSKCSNEENYLFQRIARVIVNTNNIDNGGFIYGQSLLKLMDEKTGGGYRKKRLSDLEHAEIIMILGADPNHSVPVVSYYLKRAAQQGIPVIVVDPRKTEMASIASIWLAIKPQTDLELINGLAALLHKDMAYDSSFVDRYTEGFSLFRQGLSSLDMKKISRLTGLEEALIKKTSELLKNKKISIVVGHGIVQQRYGLHTLGAVLNLALMTGSLGTTDAGIHILAKENNQLGAMDMGSVPDCLPGRQSIEDEVNRNNWEKNWKIPISPNPGLNLVRMLEEAEKGNIKALYIMAENPTRALPQTEKVKKALRNIEFIIAQDILNNETVKLADVVLPGAALSEKRGSVTNLEGRIQFFKPVTPPPGKAKPDWEILDLLAARLTGSSPYGSLEKIRREIRRLVPMYGSLDGPESTWVVPVSEKSLFDSQGANGPVTFYPVVSTEDETVDNDYPWIAIVGSLRYHLGSGTRTQASDRIQGFEMKDRIEVSPEAAQNHDLNEDDLIIVHSKFGTLRKRIRLKRGLHANHIFIPTGFNDNDAMQLFSLPDMANPDSPGWKTCPVRVEKASAEG